MSPDLQAEMSEHDRALEDLSNIVDAWPHLRQQERQKLIILCRMKIRIVTEHTLVMPAESLIPHLVKIAILRTKVAETAPGLVGDMNNLVAQAVVAVEQEN